MKELFTLLTLCIALISCNSGQQSQNKPEYTLDSLASDIRKNVKSDQKVLNNRVSYSIHNFDGMDILIFTNISGSAVTSRNLTLEALQVKQLQTAQ